MSESTGSQQIQSLFRSMGPDHSLGELADAVSHFAHENKVAAKSIGVEYLESAKHLVVTLGYAENEPAYDIELKAVSLGKTHSLGAGSDFTALEQAMGEAAAKAAW